MRFLFIIISIFIVFSCKQDNLGKSVSIEKSQWYKNTKLSYQLPIVEGTGIYDINLVVRNNNTYPYQNLWLFIESGKGKDTLQYILADETGSWLGTGMGNTKEIELKYKANQPLNAKDTLRINIQHAMRTNVLNGIEDISVILHKIK